MKTFMMEMIKLIIIAYVEVHVIAYKRNTLTIFLMILLD